MLKTVDGAAISVSKLWVFAVLAGSVALAGAAGGQDGSALQPQGLNWVGIHALRELEPSLTGAGVGFGLVCRSFTYSEDGEPQNDYRPNVDHSCFQNANLRFYDEAAVPAGVSPHSTAICSILFGEDPEGVASYLPPFLYQGAVPAAEGKIYEFWHFVADYVLTGEIPDIDIVAASFGQPFEDWWTRVFESLIDRDGLVVVASIGNGSNASDPPFYPGAGPNAIGVGVVSSVNAKDPATKLAHFALAYPEQSSSGPTDDGRCKPDLIAPGNCLVAETNGRQDYAMSGSWSSFSTPVTAGVVGLLVQTARQDRRLGGILSPNGGNCAVKAILMSSATKLPYWHKGRVGGEDDDEVPLDHVQGAGMVNALGAHRLLTAGRVRPGGIATIGWDLNELDRTTTFQQVYRMVVDEPADKVLTVTLAWNRHYEQKYPFKRIGDRDSDLRLDVLAIDPQDSSKDRVFSSDSKVDNVEHIWVETSPEYALYEIVVSYSDPDAGVSSDIPERYGVAWELSDKVPDDSILKHDLNADGIVDEIDLGILMNNLAVVETSPEAYTIGDVNTDGSIDIRDIEELNANRNRKASWHSETVAN